MPNETTTSKAAVPDVLFETIQLLDQELRKHYGANFSYTICGKGQILSRSNIEGIIIPLRSVARKASTLLLALAFSSAALSAASAPCKNVRFEDGSNGRFRETKSGLTRCNYTIDMVHVNGPGLPPVKVTKATPDSCRVEILEKGMDAARVVQAHEACVDASHAAAEKEVTPKGGAK